MTGCDAVDLGIVPTPTVELAVLYHEAAGGIAITASHNPSEWNALKFFNSLGEFITKKQYEQLEKIASSSSVNFATHDKLGTVTYDDSVVDRHIKDVLNLDVIPKADIKKARFRVVVDAINGAGSRALPELLERLGVKVIRLNCKGDGDFYRKPEPVAENLSDLGKAVVTNNADLGLACDPDADRLALVDETGRPIGEELTLTLSIAYFLTRKKGPIAINLSTSSMTADVARMVGSPVFYSPVGEANVIAEMRRRKAIIGGEGNGGVILPECHYGRDALVAAALIMSYLARSKKNLSTLAGTIPAYINIKKKASLPKEYDRKVFGLEKVIRNAFGKVSVDSRDGLRFDLDEGWIQIRKSNTEPIYRLIAEARTDRLARQLVKLVSGSLK
jgi:phosphomannomutase